MLAGCFWAEFGFVFGREVFLFPYFLSKGDRIQIRITTRFSHKAIELQLERRVMFEMVSVAARIHEQDDRLFWSRIWLLEQWCSWAGTCERTWVVSPLTHNSEKKEKKERKSSLGEVEENRRVGGMGDDVVRKKEKKKKIKLWTGSEEILQRKERKSKKCREERADWGNKRR